MNFSEKMDELDKILKKLEGESVPLEDALAEFERGVKLVRECREYLDSAKQKISVLTDGGIKTANAARKGEDDNG